MTPAEQLHLDATAYANKRRAMHKEAIKQQKQTPLDDKVHNGTWIAHYEGYVAGYEAKRPWVGLTAEQAAECWTTSATQTWKNFETKLKELNA